MANSKYSAPLKTVESIRLAARANNEAKGGGSMRRRKSLVMMLNQQTQSLTKQDVARWRKAWAMALNIENPRRGPLYSIYTDVLIDTEIVCRHIVVMPHNARFVDFGEDGSLGPQQITG